MDQRGVLNSSIWSSWLWEEEEISEIQETKYCSYDKIRIEVGVDTETVTCTMRILTRREPTQPTNARPGSQSNRIRVSRPDFPSSHSWPRKAELRAHRKGCLHRQPGWNKPARSGSAENQRVPPTRQPSA